MSLGCFIQDNREEFCQIPEDVYDMIWVLAGERRLKSLKQKIMNEKEMYDMCQEIQTFGFPDTY